MLLMLIMRKIYLLKHRNSVEQKLHTGHSSVALFERVISVVACGACSVDREIRLLATLMVASSDRDSLSGEWKR